MARVIRKIPTNPRKSPKQERSRETVEILLQAAAHILVREGYDRASTNRIAKEAGISIGSLYQYFPSKEAIVGALVKRQLAEELALIEPRLAAAAGGPIETVVRELIQAVFEMHSVNPKLRRIIIEQVPRVGSLQKMDVQAKLATRVEEALEMRKGEIRPRNGAMAAFILVHAVEAVIHAALIKRPEWLHGTTASDSAELVEEITSLVLGYLALR